MGVLYGSTRGNGEKITASMAILKGLEKTADCLYRIIFRRWMCL